MAGSSSRSRTAVAALAFATVAAPGRLVQAPFAATDVGTGYVVLARRSGVTRPAACLVIGTFDPDDASLPPVAAAARPARLRRRGPQRRLLGRRPRSRRGRSPVADAAAASLGDCRRGARYLATCERARRRRVPLPRAPRRVRARPDRADPPHSRGARRVHLALRHGVVDRGLRSPRSPVALATRALDVLACWSVPMVVVDTPEHADFFARFTHRARAHFAVLWVGAEESRVRSRTGSRRRRADPLVPHVYPAARLRDRGARGRVARRRRPPLPPDRRRPGTRRGRGARSQPRAHEHRVRRAGRPRRSSPGEIAPRLDLPRRVRNERQGGARGAEQGVPVRGRGPRDDHRGHPGDRHCVRRRRS